MTKKLVNELEIELSDNGKLEAKVRGSLPIPCRGGGIEEFDKFREDKFDLGDPIMYTGYKYSEIWGRDSEESSSSNLGGSLRSALDIGDMIVAAYGSCCGGTIATYNKKTGERNYVVSPVSGDMIPVKLKSGEEGVLLSGGGCRYKQGFTLYEIANDGVITKRGFSEGNIGWGNLKFSNGRLVEDRTEEFKRYTGKPKEDPIIDITDVVERLGVDVSASEKLLTEYAVEVKNHRGRETYRSRTFTDYNI